MTDSFAADARLAEELCGQDEHLQRTEELAGLLSVQSAARILDVGCGTGSSTRLLARNNPDCRVVGIDASPLVIRRAMQQERLRGPGGMGNLEYTVMDARALRYADAAFDIVFCSRVLVHSFDADGILGEMLRVIGKPGQLLVIEPSACFMPGVDSGLYERTLGFPNPSIGKSLERRLRALGADSVRCIEHSHRDSSRPDVARMRMDYEAGQGLRALAARRRRCTNEEVETFFRQLEHAAADPEFHRLVMHSAALVELR